MGIAWGEKMFKNAYRSSHGCEIDDFSITFGLHQGSSLNPHLFDIVMNEYINRI